MKTVLKNFLIGTVLLAISCVLVGLSLFIPTTLQNRTELEHVNLGFPLHFVVQDQSPLPVGYPEGPQFPIRQGFLSPWEYPFQIIWWRFLLDIFIVLVALILALRIMKKFKYALLITVLGFISCILVGLSIFIPVTIGSPDDLEQVELGYPLHFIVQRQARLRVFISEEAFPIRVGFKEFPWPFDYPFQIIWWRFLLDIFIVLVALILILRIMKKFKYALLITVLGFISCILVGLSIFIPVTVSSPDELEQVELGYPLHFIVQRQAKLRVFISEEAFPIRVGFKGFPWPLDYPFQIVWRRFLLDIFIILVTVILALRITKALFQLSRDKIKRSHQA